MKKKSEVLFNIPRSKGRSCCKCSGGKILMGIFMGLLVIPSLIVFLSVLAKNDKEAYY